MAGAIVMVLVCANNDVCHWESLVFRATMASSYCIYSKYVFPIPSVWQYYNCGGNRADDFFICILCLVTFHPHQTEFIYKIWRYRKRSAVYELYSPSFFRSYWCSFSSMFELVLRKKTKSMVICVFCFVFHCSGRFNPLE